MRLNKGMKRAVASIVAAGVIASAAPAIADTGMEMPTGFVDTPAIEAFLPTVSTPTDITGNWAEADIKDMLAIGAVKGYPDKTFRPKKAVTRAEYATMMASGLQLPGVEEGVELRDVSESFWAYSNIQKSLPYLPALADGSFRPNVAATREDVAASLVLATGLDKKATDPAPLSLIFADYKTVSPELQGLIAIAVDQKLIKGYKVTLADDASIKPQYDGNADGDLTDPEDYVLKIKAQNFVTRAETCNLLNNARKERPLGFKLAPATGDEE